MTAITVHEDYEDGGVAFTPFQLAHGESSGFGRGGDGMRVHLLFAAGDRAVARRAGIIESLGYHWRLTNTSGTRTYVVEHTDPVSGFVQVRPGGRGMVIPFETSRVRIPGADREYRFLVLVPEIPFQPPRSQSEEHSSLAPFGLDPWNGYFRVMVAFCEPRLRDPSCLRIPSTNEVSRRLDASVSAVNGQITYLLEEKLRLPHSGKGPGVAWRQRVLVDYALRFGLVTKEHLHVLPEPDE